MLICNNCGKVIHEEDLEKNQDIIGYIGDRPIYESNKEGCVCGGDFEEAIKCDFCEEYVSVFDIVNSWKTNNNICRNCFNRYKDKYKNEYKNFVELYDEDEFLDYIIENGLLLK